MIRCVILQDVLSYSETKKQEKELTRFFKSNKNIFKKVDSNYGDLYFFKEENLNMVVSKLEQYYIYREEQIYTFGEYIFELDPDFILRNGDEIGYTAFNEIDEDNIIKFFNEENQEKFFNAKNIESVFKECMSEVLSIKMKNFLKASKALGYKIKLK